MLNTHTLTRPLRHQSSNCFPPDPLIDFVVALLSISVSRVSQSVARQPSSRFQLSKKKKKKRHTSVSVDKWQAGGAVSKVNLRQTPSNITFPSRPCGLLSTQLRRCQHRDLASARTYSLSGVTRGRHSHFNWYHFHSSASSCVFWRYSWLVM